MKIEHIALEALIPYARNSRTHSEAQVAQIAGSIREFGFTNPVLIDGAGGIIAGHGRVMAARKIGLEQVPCIRLDYLTEAQRRAYVIADNKLAMNAGWDDEMLRLELLDLQDAGFDLDLTGFDAGEIEAIINGVEDGDGEALSENYSRKIEVSIYTPKGEKPPVAALYDEAKAKELREQIEAAELPDDVRRFLEVAADRHTVFNFRNIAEFYAHADEAVQDLMERSALVIIDYDKAIENGFVDLSKAMIKQAGNFGERSEEVEDDA